MQDTVYQIVSTRTVNTQHGPSTILPLQKADRSCCNAWPCGMLTNELLQNPMVMGLAVICTTNIAENEQDWKDTIHINCCRLMILLTIVIYLFLPLSRTPQGCCYLLSSGYASVDYTRYEKVTSFPLFV